MGCGWLVSTLTIFYPFLNFVFSYSTPFYFEELDEKLLRAIDYAERNLKVYVYPIPSDIRRCTKPFRSGLKEMFDMELRLPEYFKSKSLVGTLDAEKADIFIVNHEWICLRIGSEPEQPIQLPRRRAVFMNKAPNSEFTGNVISRDHMLPILRNVIQNYPYYNRSSGKDHALTFVFDNGPFCGAIHTQPSSPFTKEVLSILENMIIIGNNGYLGKNNWSKHCEKPCTSTQKVVDYCFRMDSDIVIPQAHSFHQLQVQHKNKLQFKDTSDNDPSKTILTGYDPSKRRSDTYFRGTRNGGRDCSPNVRTKLENLHIRTYQNASVGVAAGQSAQEPRIQYLWQRGSMSDAVFAFCPAGGACWSMRLYHAIFSDTIPVILADPVIEPFERFLNWQSFTVKYLSDVPSNNTSYSVNTDSSEDKAGVNMDGKYLSHQLVFENMLRNLHELSDEARLVEGKYAQKQTQIHNHLSGKLSISRTELSGTSLVHRKIAAMRAIAPWLAFDSNATRSAYKLVTLELWCRSKKGMSNEYCKRPVSRIAYRAYH